MKNWQLYIVLTALMGLSFLSMASQVKAIYWCEIGTSSGTDFDNNQEAHTSGWVSSTLKVETNFPVCSIYRYTPSYTKGGLNPNLGQYWNLQNIITIMYHEGSGQTVKHWAGIINVGSPNLIIPLDYSTTLKAYVHFSETTTNFDWWTE
ncbi:hypothetical protein [Candidatus Harpocratesius sp.]